MKTKIDYASLLEYCSTDHQKKVIKSLIQTNHQEKTAKKLGIDRTAVNKVVKRVKYIASKAGYSPEHDMTHTAPEGFTITGTSTLYATDEETGQERIASQWVKTKKEDADRYKQMQEAINDMVSNASGQAKPKKLQRAKRDKDLLTVYISNDLHFGAYMWSEETLDRDYDLKIAEDQLTGAIGYLVDASISTKECIVADLGDMLEADNFKNATPNSGNPLDVDGRYSKVIRVAMQAMVNLIARALEKHETVHFINIGGNHDIVTSHAIRAFVEAWYRDEPRVKVDVSPAPQKYFYHGSTLLGFAHGDGLKMHDAGETMAMHNGHKWGETQNRYYHFGHNHKDKVVDGRLCKAESHRNIAPLNSWASHAGFGRQIGTMKSITYCKKHGEINRNTFNVAMGDE